MILNIDFLVYFYNIMRLLLFIPVLVLFLSNVPFIQKMPFAKAVAMIAKGETCGQQKECSRHNENLQGNCDLEGSGCEHSSEENTKIGGTGDDDCCQKTESTCVCICCFQFAAPVQVIAEFKFNCSSNSNISALFIVGHVKNPYIAAPWQPPDGV
jgi:hypothetical protein